MKQIPAPILAAMRKAIAEDQNAEPEDFLVLMDRALADPLVRDAIRDQWITVMLQVADEEGGEYTLDEVRDAMTEAINDVVARKATTP